MASARENIKESNVSPPPKDSVRESPSPSGSPKGLKNFLGLSVREMSARFDSSGDEPKGGNGGDQPPSPGKNATRKMSRKTVQDRLGDLSDSEDELLKGEGEKREVGELRKRGEVVGATGPVAEMSQGKKASPRKTEVRAPTRTRIPSPENRKSMPRESGSVSKSGENSPKTASPKGSPKAKAGSVSSGPARELTDAEIQAEVDKMYAFHDEEPDSLDFVQANSDGSNKGKENLTPTEGKGGHVLADLDDAELESQILPELSDTGLVEPSAPSAGTVTGNKRAGSGGGGDEKVAKRKMKASGDDFGSIPDLSLGLRDLSKLPVKEVPIVPTRTWVTGTKKNDGEKDMVEGSKGRPRSKLPSPTRSFDDALRSPRSKSPTKRNQPVALNLPDLEQVWKEIQQTKIYMEEDIQKSSECLKVLSATCGLGQSDRLSLSREYDLDVLEMPDTTLRTSQFEDLLSKLGDCEDVGWEELIGNEEIEAVIADASLSRTNSGTKSQLKETHKDEKVKRENYELEISNLTNVIHKLKEEIISGHKATAKKDAFLIKLIKAWADVRKQWKVHETRSKLIIERVQAENNQSTTSDRGGKKVSVEETVQRARVEVEQSESPKNQSRQVVKGRDASPDKSKISKQQDDRMTGVEEMRGKLSAAEEKATYYQRELEQSAQQNKGLQDWLNSISKQKDNLESKIADLADKLAMEQAAKDALEKSFSEKLEKEEEAQVTQLQAEYRSKFEQHLETYKSKVITTQTTLIEKHQKQLKEIEMGTSNIYKEHRDKSVMDVLKAIQRQGQDLQVWRTEIIQEDKWSTLVSEQLSAFEKRGSSTGTNTSRKIQGEAKTRLSAETGAQSIGTTKRRTAPSRISAEKDVKIAPLTPPKTKPAPVKSAETAPLTPPKTKPALEKASKEPPKKLRPAKPAEAAVKRGKTGSSDGRKISDKNSSTAEIGALQEKSETASTLSPKPRSRPGYAGSTYSRDMARIKKQPQVAEFQVSLSTDVTQSTSTSSERADRTSNRRERANNVTKKEGSTRTAKSVTTETLSSAATTQTESRQRAKRVSSTTGSKFEKTKSSAITVAVTEQSESKTSKTSG